MDADYIAKKLNLIQRDLKQYTADELGRELRRLAATGSEDEEITKLKQERDEAVAQVEVMREAATNLVQAQGCGWGVTEFCTAKMKDALSITPSAALREIEARTLDEIAENAPDDASERYCRARAEAKRKGE